MQVYNRFATGEVSGSLTAKQLPSKDFVRMVQFIAPYSNAGYVFVGGAGVTIPDGTDNDTAGLPLGPGDATPLLPALNLDYFWIICESASDSLTYLLLG